jgi:enoyl-CoA hydratase
MSSAARPPVAPDDVLVRWDNGVLVVTINRPGQRNAVNGAVSAGIARALDLLDSSADLRVGVLHGDGPAFCAGMDLKAFAAGEPVRDPVRGFGGIVERPPAKPLIAAVEGWALGGGFEIVLACDLVIAGQGARFGLPEARRGLAARGGGVFRVPRRLPRAVALELLFTGAPLDAARAEHFGLVNRVVDDGQALAAALELAAQVAASAPMSVRASKAVAVDSASWPPGEEFERQRAYLEPVFASRDAAEGVAAFRERRDPVWQDR